MQISRNVSCVRTILDKSEWPICECTRDGPCTDESNCLNRILFFECNASTCKAGTKCQNQRMQRCQYKKLEKFMCNGRGWGLKSKQGIITVDFLIRIPKGKIAFLNYRISNNRKSLSFDFLSLKDGNSN